MNPLNLAQHGIHPRWYHVVINFPLLLGIKNSILKTFSLFNWFFTMLWLIKIDFWHFWHFFSFFFIFFSIDVQSCFLLIHIGPMYVAALVPLSNQLDDFLGQYFGLLDKKKKSMIHNYNTKKDFRFFRFYFSHFLI